MLQRVIVKPRSTEAKRKYNGRMKYGMTMYVDDKKHEWHLRSSDGRIDMWIHPTDDPHWEIVR